VVIEPPSELAGFLQFFERSHALIILLSVWCRVGLRRDFWYFFLSWSCGQNTLPLSSLLSELFWDNCYSCRFPNPLGKYLALSCAHDRAAHLKKSQAAESRPGILREQPYIQSNSSRSVSVARGRPANRKIIVGTFRFFQGNAMEGPHHGQISGTMSNWATWRLTLR